jgi:DNA-binding beta-propeller fold protein YncE
MPAPKTGVARAGYDPSVTATPEELDMQRLRRLIACAFTFFVALSLAAGGDAPKAAEIKGHDALVYSIAFSPDGKVLASAGFDSIVKLWEFPAGKLQRDLKGHTGAVYCVAYSKDGTMLASASLDKTIRLWNPADGKPIRELKGHTDIVDSVAWSPDGKLLASGSGDKSVRLWNPEDGKETKKLGSHAKSVYAVAFSPDGKYLASGGADNLVKVYDVAAAKELKQLKGHEDPVTGLLFTADSKSIVSISQDRTVRIWDVEAGKETKKLGPTEDDLYGIALSPDGKAVATSGYAGWVKVWDLEAGKATFSQKLTAMPGREKAFGAYCVAFTPDGKALVTGHDNKSIYVTPIGNERPRPFTAGDPPAARPAGGPPGHVAVCRRSAAAEVAGSARAGRACDPRSGWPCLRRASCWSRAGRPGASRERRGACSPSGRTSTPQRPDTPPRECAVPLAVPLAWNAPPDAGVALMGTIPRSTGIGAGRPGA